MNEKIIPIKPTSEEQRWVALMRLNKLLGRKEIKKSIRIGRIEVDFEWRSKDNLWGRFGGGWNWHVGAQWSSRTILIFCLVFMVRIGRARP